MERRTAQLALLLVVLLIAGCGRQAGGRCGGRSAVDWQPPACQVPTTGWQASSVVISRARHSLVG